MTFLSHRFIPSFLERKHQSAIVNLSSQSIVYNLRTLSVYTGTKAYNNSFSKCLSEDYKGNSKLTQIAFKSLTVDLTLSRLRELSTQKILCPALHKNALDGL